MKFTCLVAIAALVAATGSFASERNDIASCYDYSQLTEVMPSPSGRQLTVVVDQTLVLPDDLQRDAWDHIIRFVKPGDEIKLYSFSAVVNNQYMKLHFSGKLDSYLTNSARNDVNMTKLRKLDNCLKGQMNNFSKVFGGRFVQALKEASFEHPRSEILTSLRAVATDLKRTQSQDKVIFIISDMMEYSEHISFYGAENNVPAALKAVEARKLFSDFGNARVYVSGAGILKDKDGSYYPGERLESLEKFWMAYFERSNAHLEGFGTPGLYVELN